MARTKNTSPLGEGAGPTNEGTPSQNRVMPGAASRIGRPGGTADTGGGGGGGNGSGGTGGGGGRVGAVIRNPVSSKAGGLDLRQVFTGATLKKIMGLPTIMADVVFGKVKHLDGASVTTIAPDRSDVYIAFVDVLSGIPGIGRLFSPGNIFWRLPKSGDSVTVLKHSEVDGPGAPYVLHGDGGAANAVPTWLGANDAGIYAPENVHIESGNNVIIKAASGAGTQAGQDDSFTSTITMHGNNGSITIDGGISPDANLTINLNGGAKFTVNAGGGSIQVQGDGTVVFNNGFLKVARISDQVQGTAGPYPIMNGLISGPGATKVLA